MNGASEMNLVHAWTILRTSGGKSPADPDRSAAAVRVFDEIRALAICLRCEDHDREDVAQETFFKLWRSAIPGKGLPEQAVSDGLIRGYLFRALKNNLISMIRRSDRVVPLLDSARDGLAVPGEGGDEFPEATAEDGQTTATSWVRRLRDEVAPRAAACLRGKAGEDLLRSLDQMVRMKLDGVETIDILREEALVHAGSGEEDLERARNSLQNRHVRTRKRLLEYVESLRGKEWNPEDIDSMVKVIDWLKRRRSAESGEARNQGASRGRDDG